MTRLTRRDFFTRGVPGSVAALLGTAAAAAPAAQRSATGDVSARDLRKVSRTEVRQALGRIRAKRRAR